MSDEDRHDDERPPTPDEWRQWAEAQGLEYSEGRGPKARRRTAAGGPASRLGAAVVGR